MAHFARINENNIVTEVVVVPDEQEHRGNDFLSVDLGLGGEWLQTSYNTQSGIHLDGGVPFRKNFAGIGFAYDETRDAFIPPTPYASWVLDENTCLWESPIPHPSDGKDYYWDEENIAWVEIVSSIGDTNIVILGDE